MREERHALLQERPHLRLKGLAIHALRALQKDGQAFECTVGNGLLGSKLQLQLRHLMIIASLKLLLKRLFVKGLHRFKLLLYALHRLLHLLLLLHGLGHLALQPRELRHILRGVHEPAREDLDGRVSSRFKEEYEDFKFWENHLTTQSHNLHQHDAQIMKSRNNQDNILKYLQEARNFNQTLATNLDHFNSMALERFSYAL